VERFPIGRPKRWLSSHLAYNLHQRQASCIKVRDLLRLIEDDGWYEVAQKGSQRQFKHPSKPGRVTVAGHPSQELDRGTLNRILKQADLT
jgi:predicted RNA binding protein YcfA (HicA-like mRNA interferase family)